MAQAPISCRPPPCSAQMFSFPWRCVVVADPTRACVIMHDTQVAVCFGCGDYRDASCVATIWFIIDQSLRRLKDVQFIHSGVSPDSSFHAVTLSQDGRELWTATEGSSSGGVSITGHRRVVAGEKWQWQLTHSFAALSGLSREAQTSRMVLHLLPASRCIAVVCSNGLVCILCIEDTAAPPLRIPLVCPT